MKLSGGCVELKKIRSPLRARTILQLFWPLIQPGSFHCGSGRGDQGWGDGEPGTTQTLRIGHEMSSESKTVFTLLISSSNGHEKD